MRILTLLLVLLVAGRFALEEWFYRQASDDLVIRAYRNAAISGCAKAAETQDGVKAGAGIDAIGWRMVEAIDYGIGRRGDGYGVYLWEVNHPRWSERYRDPVLRLVASDTGTVCEFDILRGIAALSRT